jgi:aminoglycoside phosphotransferase (APT) family kinase protein
MIAGTPHQSRWLKPSPRRSLTVDLLRQMVDAAFPHRNVVHAESLTDGLRNANFKLQFDRKPEFVVLRLYEHDASLCQKEVDLLDLIKDSVPTPTVLHAEPVGGNGIPPFLFLEYVDGISFRELKRNESADSIAEAAGAVGRVLASIGHTTFSRSGWLGPGPEVGAPLLEGANPAPRFVDLCLASANLQRRVSPDLRERITSLVWSYADAMASLDAERRLVHGDFGGRNLLMRRVAGRWEVAAVLDWEFAISASPLTDLGHFLRYESAARPCVERHFSQGYLQAGGRLPDDWRRLARVLDLIALCESLTHDELPQAVVAELVELVRATVENRDPRVA